MAIHPLNILLETCPISPSPLPQIPSPVIGMLEKSEIFTMVKVFIFSLFFSVPQHSYHENVSSARARLQFLLSNSRPSSAMPHLQHSRGADIAVQQHPHRNPYTPAQGLQSAPENMQTMSAAPLREGRQRPATAFTTYTESYHFPS